MAPSSVSSRAQAAPSCRSAAAMTTTRPVNPRSIRPPLDCAVIHRTHEPLTTALKHQLRDPLQRFSGGGLRGDGGKRDKSAVRAGIFVASQQSGVHGLEPCTEVTVYLAAPDDRGDLKRLRIAAGVVGHSGQSGPALADDVG